ncbi:MAG: class I SAM-dependent methyltransferase [Vicinamibacterales bacterium]
MAEPLIRDISDTARWVAVYRARETDRPDAVFRDPFARALAGDRGEQIARAMPFGDKNAWSFVARTYAFDRLIAREVAAGADLVVNLAAGLDARPYRMDLPPTLKWMEVDLPEILAYKEEVLAVATPVCALERVGLDLSNYDARRGLFNRIARTATRAVVVTEGLLMYLMPAEVGELARDLAARSGLERWIVDVASPGLMKMMDEHAGDLVRQAGVPFLFAPSEGPAFFTPYGWQVLDVRSLLKTAGRLHRLPPFLRLMSLFPESNGPQGSRPWSAVCLLGRRPEG